MKKTEKPAYSEAELRRRLNYRGVALPAGLKRRTLERLGLRLDASARATALGKWVWLAPAGIGAAALLLLWLLPSNQPEIKNAVPAAKPQTSLALVPAKHGTARAPLAKRSTMPGSSAPQITTAPIPDQKSVQASSRSSAESWGSQQTVSSSQTLSASQQSASNALPSFSTGGGVAPGAGGSSRAASASKPSDEPRPTAIPVPAAYQLKVKHNRFFPGKGETLLLTLNLTKAGQVRVVAYDMDGRQVSVVADQQAGPGALNLRWDGGNAPSGVYTLIVQTPDKTENVKAVLIR